MMTTKAMPIAYPNDAELVAESLNGNPDAFRRIVERYQALISSLAYCATGNVSKSEDLAQETFLTAWKQLGDLREPEKLRPWLCSIVRFRISKDFRRQGCEPMHNSESLEALDELVSSEPLPLDRLISEEERAVLWRSLERIPEIYREPLVLFYREHQSIETVARDLELSEDAVKQRLSRGRKLLHRQLLAFVAGALKQTSPGKTFTLGVLAALPLFSTSAKAATAAAAGKGASSAPLVPAGKASAIFMNGAMSLLSLLGVSGIAGRWAGREMRRTGERSFRGRKHLVQFWCTLAIGFTVLVLPTMLIPSANRSHTWLYHAASWSLAGFYGVVIAAVVVWIWQRWQDVRAPNKEPAKTTGSVGKSYHKWVALGVLGPALVLVKFGGGILTSPSATTIQYDQVPAAQALKIISEHKGGSDAAYFWSPDADARKIASERNNARFMVNQYQDGSKFLLIRQPEIGGAISYTAWDDSLMGALSEKGIAYKTQVVGGAALKGDVVFRYGGLFSAINNQGGRLIRMFSVWQIHHDDLRQWLVVLSTAIVAAASALLLARRATPCQNTDPVSEARPV